MRSLRLDKLVNPPSNFPNESDILLYSDSDGNLKTIDNDGVVSSVGGGGGGEAFNGGTITDKLTIAPTDDVAGSIDVQDSNGNSAILVKPNDVSEGGVTQVLAIAGDQTRPLFSGTSWMGDTVFAVKPTGAVTISPTDESVFPFTITSPGGDTDADDVMQVVNSDETQTFYLDSSGDCYITLADTSTSFLVQTPNGSRLFAVENAGAGVKIGFFGATPVTRPMLPISPTAQDISDVLVALGLVLQDS